jgi:hypothetical protein
MRMNKILLILSVGVLCGAALVCAKTPKPLTEVQKKALTDANTALAALKTLKMSQILPSRQKIMTSQYAIHSERKTNLLPLEKRANELLATFRQASEKLVGTKERQALIDARTQIFKEYETALKNARTGIWRQDIAAAPTE